MSRTLILDPTYSCNFRCGTCRCPEIHATCGRARLPRDTALNLVQAFADAGGRELLIFGGEPLLVGYIYELLAFASDLGLRVELTTNGSLLTPENATYLASSGVDAVTISLDGDAAGHEAVRGSGTYEKTVGGAGNFVRAARESSRPPGILNLHCTVSRLNVGHFAGVVDRAAHLGYATSVSLSYLSLLYRDDVATIESLTGKSAQAAKSHWRLPAELLLRQGDLESLRYGIAEVQRRAAGNGVDVRIDPALLVDTDADVLLMCNFPLSKQCTVFETTTIIGPSGEIGSCPMLTEFSFGNIKETTLADVLSDRSRFEPLKTMMRGGYTPVCRRCCNHADLMERVI